MTDGLVAPAKGHPMTSVPRHTRQRMMQTLT
jgi:hypothetical protein